MLLDILHTECGSFQNYHQAVPQKPLLMSKETKVTVNKCDLQLLYYYKDVLLNNTNLSKHRFSVGIQISCSYLGEKI